MDESNFLGRTVNLCLWHVIHIFGKSTLTHEQCTYPKITFVDEEKYEKYFIQGQERFCFQATSFLQCQNESIAAKFKTLLLFKEINRNRQRQQTGELEVFAETKND